MPSVDELVFRATLKDDMSRGLAAIKGEMESLNASVGKVGSTSNQRGVSSTSAAFGGLGRQVSSVDAQMRNLSRSADQLALHALKRGAQGFGILAGAAVGFGIRADASFQRSRIAFGTLLDDVDAGNRLFAQLQQFNFSTPFGLGDIAGATQTLLQFGFTAGNVMTTLKSISDVAATSQDPSGNLGRIALALGQIRSAGVLRAQDLNQLVQAGFPAYQLLTQVTGKTTAEIRKQMDAGLTLPASQFIAAMNSGQGVMARFAGGAEKQAHTLSGVFSNLKDTINIQLGAAFQPLADELVKELPGLSTSIGQFITATAPHLNRLLITLMHTGERLMPVFSDSLGKAMGELEPMMPDVMEAFVAMVGLLPDMVRLLGDLVPLVTPLVHLVGSLADMHGVALGLLTVFLGYRALSGIAGIIIKFAGALDILAASERGVAAAEGMGGVGGVGRGGKSLLKGGAALGGGFLAFQGIQGDSSLGKDAETLAGGAMAGAPFGLPGLVVGTSAAAGLVLGRRAWEWTHGGAPTPTAPPGAFDSGTMSYDEYMQKYGSQTILAPGAVVVNNPTSNVDVSGAVQQGIADHHRAQARRGARTGD